jgi:dienelactone hydrolase
MWHVSEDDGSGAVKFLLFLLVLGACSVTAPATTGLSFDAGSVGGPGSNDRAELFVPKGAGPFPAVVVLHGCDGVGPHYSGWAEQLRAWGYVAMLVDSFRPRGIDNVCNHGMDLPPLVQAQDAFAAADYLRGLPNVRADRIGVIGFSHGGWAVLKAVLAGPVRQDHATPFVAAVAFYPGCETPESALATDTLILIGDADDWTPVERCQRWYDEVQRAGHTLQMKVYPGARHAFDGLLMPHFYGGHYLGRDPRAAADALVETKDFFAQRLSP